MSENTTIYPTTAKRMAAEEATASLLMDLDPNKYPNIRPGVNQFGLNDANKSPVGPRTDAEPTDSDLGVSRQTATDSLVDDAQPDSTVADSPETIPGTGTGAGIDDASTGTSAFLGYNGSGSTKGMTGVGASTDTGSNGFISGAGGVTDPGYDKGPVVGDGSEAFPNEVHGSFDGPKAGEIHERKVVPTS